MSVRVRLLYQCHVSILRKMPSQQQHLLPIHHLSATSPPRSPIHASKKGSDDEASSFLINGFIKSKYDYEPLIGSGRRGFGSGAGGEREARSPERQRMERSGGDVESGEREETVGEEVERVVGETWMVTRLGVTLLGYLGYHAVSLR